MICRHCEQDTDDEVSCEESEDYDKIPWGDESYWDSANPYTRCADCGTPVGGFHHHGCRQEECDTCGDRVVDCDCTGYKEDPWEDDD